MNTKRKPETDLPNMSAKQEEPTPSFYPNEDYKSVLPEETGAPYDPNGLLRAISTLGHPGPFLDEGGRIAVRCFRIDSVVHLAFLIEETHDSFYVVFPSVLNRDGSGMISAMSPLSSAVVRLLKTANMMIGMPSPSQVLYFLSLSEHRFEELPSFFTAQRKSHITNLISLIRSQLKVVRIDSQGETPQSESQDVSKEPEKSGSDKIIIGDQAMSKLVH